MVLKIYLMLSIGICRKMETHVKKPHMQNNNWNKIWSKSQKLLERGITSVLLKETKKEIVKR